MTAAAKSNPPPAAESTPAAAAASVPRRPMRPLAPGQIQLANLLFVITL
jgi:hypothetical protein